MTFSDISVIVPTYNGLQKLPNILAALESQTVKAFEVIVVVDGSTDDTLSYLNGYQAKSFVLRIVNRENGGRARVRNAGSSASDKELLIFYDDDMRPNEDSVQRHIAFHKQHREAICGGNQLEDIALAKNDFDRYRCELRTSWVGQYRELQRLKATNIHLTAANFSISKKAFDALGGFKNSLTDHEDLDLATRAFNQGFQVFFDPENIGWHDDFISVRAYVKRRREYSKARQTEQVGTNKVIVSDFLKKWLIYNWFSAGWFANAIQYERLVFLPERLRYRCYSLIIWGLADYFPNRSIE